MTRAAIYGGGRPSDYGTLAVKLPGRRRELAGYARLLGLRGYVVGRDGNLSLRRDASSMLITPTDVAYDALRPGQVCRLGLDGSPAGGGRVGGAQPSSEWRLHAALYAARPDVNAIVHAHPIHACALAANREPLPRLLDEVGAVLGGEVAVADYAPSGSAELGQAAAAALADRQAVLLANHGSVTVGETLAQAFYRLEILERSAQVFWLARLTGPPTLLG